MKKRILPEWNTYRRAVLHPDSPPNQVGDVRNAFYAGCVSMFRMITKLSERLSETKAMRALEELTRELAEHADEANKVATLSEGPMVKGGRNDPPTTPRPSDPKPQPKMGISGVISHHTEPKVVVGAIHIEEYGFAGWCPTQDGSGPLEQLHLRWKMKGFDEADFAIRFKTREKWDQFMAMGDDIADQIWPRGDEGTT